MAGASKQNGGRLRGRKQYGEKMRVWDVEYSDVGC